jgi:hypothetical protein
MIPPWRESGLADEPAERRHQGEQVDPVDSMYGLRSLTRDFFERELALSDAM